LKSDNIDTKTKIHNAVLKLLENCSDADSITTRQIAAKAGVNIALVNYYYKSKDNLLSEIVGKMMGNIISTEMRKGEMQENPEKKLRNILKVTADAAFENIGVCKIAINAELNRGCVNSCIMVKPLLKEIFRDSRLNNLDTVALQLMLPFHHIILNPELYGKLLNTDFFNKQDRDQEIDRMISFILIGSIQ